MAAAEEERPPLMVYLIAELILDARALCGPQLLTGHWAVEHDCISFYNSVP
jgi:hypothetical protein